MNELIREYGRVMLSALECILVAGIIGTLCTQVAGYLEYFADRLMGG